MLIKAAINGGRSRAEHAAVPLSPQEQAAAAVKCLTAGANAIHLHVRSTSADGSAQSAGESLYPEDVTPTLRAVLAVCPKELIGVSTGAWILPDTARRLQVVAAWEVLPGFASVNFTEEGAAELARLLLSRGVDVESGLSDRNGADVFVKSGLIDRCIRVLIEPQEQEMENALQTTREIEKILRAGLEHPRLPPVLLHGTEATVWPMMAEAIKKGHDVRVGLEDTLVMPDGQMARDNVELVMEAVRQVKTKQQATRSNF